MKRSIFAGQLTLGNVGLGVDQIEASEESVDMKIL
jgi:hypothetical protein